MPQRVFIFRQKLQNLALSGIKMFIANRLIQIRKKKGSCRGRCYRVFGVPTYPPCFPFFPSHINRTYCLGVERLCLYKKFRTKRHILWQIVKGEWTEGAKWVILGDLLVFYLFIYLFIFFLFIYFFFCAELLKET